MKAKRLTREDLDKRVRITKSTSITKDGVNGIMLFGEDNDYPQTMELSVNGSVTAKAAAGMYSKFLVGGGFANEAINNIVVGIDQRGKDITIRSLLRQVGDSCSIHNGFYIHRNTNAEGVTGKVHLKPFKDGRFSIPDDMNFAAKILFYENWEADKDKGKNNSSSDAVTYHLFSNNEEVILAQMKDSKGEDIDEKQKNYKGQIYSQFLDNTYFYPLSPFDAAYMDVDTEQQVALYKNRTIRNGFFTKTLIRRQRGFELDQNGEYKTNKDGERIPDDTVNDEIVDFLGADGETTMILEDDLDPETGEFPKNSFEVIPLESKIDPKLFSDWEQGLKNNIRMSIRGIPAILIDYEQNQLGTTSGEAIKQATMFYNALTKDDRELISEAFRDIFKNSDNKILRENTDWTIKPLELIQEEATESLDVAETKRLESQAALKGSVGGVTALITLQQSVASGASDLDAAIEIVKEIYGIDEDKAKKMIGTPKNTNNEPTDTNAATNI